MVTTEYHNVIFFYTCDPVCWPFEWSSYIGNANNLCLIWPIYNVNLFIYCSYMTFVTAEKRSQSHQLEFLFNYYLRILQKHHKQTRLSKFLESISLGLQIYPSSPELFTALVEISHLYTVPTKLRSILDDFSNK